MTAGELFEHFLGRAPWVDRSDTADRFEAGDPSQPVHKVATGWSACTQNLRAAAADGCDLFISHEPAFGEYWFKEKRFRDTDWGRLRTHICEEHGMPLLALHDTWDFFPEYGIGDSWAQHLDLLPADLVARRPYEPSAAGHKSLSLYRVARTTADGYARHVAAKVRSLRMGGVIVMGDGSRAVEKVAIGLGCHIPEQQMLSLGADVLVQVFDRALQAFCREPLLDLGANLILVEHGCSEMPGMRNMVRYLNVNFPELQAAFYCNEPESRIVTA